MKRIAILAAASLVLGLAACNKDNKTTDSKAAPAAAKASPGAVNEKKDCGSSCSEKKDCCKEKANTSAGAVSEKKDCSSSCSEKKSSCSEKAASPGAVSGNSGCPGAGSGGTCPFAGAKNG